MEGCTAYFPAMQNDLVFCENAGGTQVPKQVIDAFNEYISNYYCQPFGCTQQSIESTKRLERAREFLNVFYNNPRNRFGHIVIGSSASQLAFNIASQFEHMFAEGDEIILCDFSHESSIGAFERMRGVCVKWWHINSQSLECEIEQLLSLITSKTRLVAFPHVSNILGNINDVAYIISQIKDCNPDIITYVDGVAFAPHDIVDVQQLGCDCYVVSFYKTFAYRISSLYLGHDVLRKCPGINHFFIDKNDFKKLELGGPQYELCSSLNGLEQYIMDIVGKNSFDRSVLQLFYKRIKDYENKLIDIFDAMVDSIPCFKCITNKNENRVPLFSLYAEDYSAEYLASLCNTLNVGCKAGTFYSNRLLTRLKIPLVLRFSFAHYNKKEDLEMIYKVLKLFVVNNRIDVRYRLFAIENSNLVRDSFNYLSEDKYYNNKRFRAFSLLKIGEPNSAPSIVGNIKFFQSSFYNSFLGGKMREYANISEKLLNDGSFRHMINMFHQKCSQLQCLSEYILIHQIRVCAGISNIPIVPEGIHRDGYNFVAIVIISRENIEGGTNILYDESKKSIMEKELPENTMLFINDRFLYHNVTGITQKEANKNAYRDIFVLTTIN